MAYCGLYFSGQRAVLKLTVLLVNWVQHLLLISTTCVHVCMCVGMRGGRLRVGVRIITYISSFRLFWTCNSSGSSTARNPLLSCSTVSAVKRSRGLMAVWSVSFAVSGAGGIWLVMFDSPGRGGKTVLGEQLKLEKFISTQVMKTHTHTQQQ